MSIPMILVVIALILALIDEFRAAGQSLTGWAVVCIAISLLWGNLQTMILGLVLFGGSMAGLGFLTCLYLVFGSTVWLQWGRE